MTAPQTPERDYVPVDGAKKRLSRGRKALIGLLVFGAVGAAAGGGTFATFTASTDNASGDDPFTVDNDMVLANTVVNGADGGVCRSDEAGGGFAEGAINPDTPNAVDCEVLFTAAELDQIASGDAVTTDIILENLSAENKHGSLRYALVPVDVDGAGSDPLQVCTNDGATAVGELCDNLAVTIQEYAYQGDRGTDDGGGVQLIDFDNDLDPVDSGNPQCVFPLAAATPCASATAEDQRVLDDTVTPTAGLIHDFDDAAALIDADMDDSISTTNEGLRFFRIRVQLVGDDATCNGIDAETGIGCTNTAGEPTDDARFTIRWVLQEN